MELDFELLSRPNKSTNLIVFLHGLGAPNTWTDENSDWRAVILNDEKLNADVGVIKYDSTHLQYSGASKVTVIVLNAIIKHVGLTLGTRELEQLTHIVSSLISILKRHPKYEKIVLVGHSMGGLIATRALLNVIRDNIPLGIVGCITIATPFNGSLLAFLRRLFTNFRSHNHVAMLEPNSQFLDETIRLWHSLRDTLPFTSACVKCFYGDEDKVVLPESAIPLLFQKDEGKSLRGSHSTVLNLMDGKETDNYKIIRSQILYFLNTNITPKDIVQDRAVGSAIGRKIREEFSPHCLLCWNRALSSEESSCDNQPISLVQPHIERLNLSKSSIIIGEAGQGKTWALHAIFQQYKELKELMVIPLLASDLASLIQENNVAQLTAGIEYLIMSAKISGKKLLLIIDAIEDIEPYSLRKKFTSTLDLIKQGSDIIFIITCRNHIYRNEIKSQLTNWNLIPFSDWPENIVKKLLEKNSIKGSFSAGLLELIKRPFYLNIFISTYNGCCDVPNIQTKHALIKAYWTLKVSDVDAVARKVILDEICRSISNKGFWLNSYLPSTRESLVVDYFLSIGLLTVINDKGAISFRHPLLRDFALSQWILAAGTYEEINVIKSSISSSIVRYGAQRALIEGIVETNQSSLSLELYYESIKENSASLDDMATVLGGLNQVESMNFRYWKSTPNSYFVHRLLVSAKVQENQSWCRFFSTLSSNHDWIENTEWMDFEVFTALIDYAVAISGLRHLDSSFQSVLSALAERLLGWLESPKYQTQLISNWWVTENVIDFMQRLGNPELLIKWLKDNANKRISSGKNLSILPHLIRKLPQSYEEDIAEIYCRAVGLTRDNSGFTVDTSLWNEYFYYSALEMSLIGTKERLEFIPLITHAPKLFIPIAVIILEKLYEMDTKESYELNRKIIESLRESTGETEQIGNIGDCNGQSINDSKFTDDRPDYLYWGSKYDIEPRSKIIDGIRLSLQNWMQSSPSDCKAFLKEMADDIRLSSILSVVFQLYLEEENGYLLRDIVFKFLTKSEVYDLRALHYWLQYALRVIWGTLTPEEKKIIYKTFDGVKRSDEVKGDILVGLLLSSIMEELPVEFAQDVRNVKEMGIDLEFPNPREEYEFSPINEDIKETFKKDFDSLKNSWSAPVSVDILKELYILDSLLTSREEDELVCDDVAIKSADIVLESMKFLPQAIEQLSQNSWPIDSVRRILVYQSKIKHKGNLALISQKNELAILEFAFTALEASEISVTADYVTDGMWVNSLRLANMLINSVANNENHIRRLLKSGRRVFNDATLISAQKTFLFEVRRSYWSKSKDNLMLLEEYLVNQVVSGTVLFPTVDILAYTQPEDTIALINRILNKHIDGGTEFSHRLGQFFGSRVLIYDGFYEFITNLPKCSLTFFQNAEYKAEFLWGTVFGLKQFAACNSERTEFISKYSNLILVLWEQIQTVGYIKRKRPSRFMLFILHWLNDNKNITNDNLREWWNGVSSFVLSVVRYGRKTEVLMICSVLKKEAVGKIIRHQEILSFADILCDRLKHIPVEEINSFNSDEENYGSWRSGIRDILSLVESVFQQTDDDKERQQCVDIVKKFAESPLKDRTAEFHLIGFLQTLEQAI